MKKLFILLCLIFITFLTIRPFLTSSYSPMHDDAQIARVFVMAKAIRDGQFPVRWVSDLGYGYGYPVFNFYAPLPYYIGAFFMAFGFNVLISTKMMMIIGIVIGAAGAYLLAAHLFGKWGGLLSACVFTLFPYRAVQLYVRGAIGELYATSLVPLVILTIFKIGNPEKRFFWVVLGGFILAGVILSHTVFGYITAGTIFLYAIGIMVYKWFKNKKFEKAGISVLMMLIIALGLSAFYWLPAIFEMQFTNVVSVIGPTADFRNHFVCLGQFWDSPWGFGGSAPGCLDGLSFRLGKIQIVLAALALLWWLIDRRKRQQNRVIDIVMITGIVIILSTIFAMVSISKPLWEMVPFASFVQYPWRLLGFTEVGMSLVIGYLLYKHRFQSLLFVGFVVAIMISSVKLFQPQYIYEQPLAAYTNEDELRFRASSVSDEYLPKDIVKPVNSEGIIRERITSTPFITVLEKKETDTYSAYEINVSDDQILTIRMAYFPGWRYFLDGKPLSLKVEKGMPVVIVSKGVHRLEMRFTNTPIRTMGNLISLLSIGILFALPIWRKKHQLI